MNDGSDSQAMTFASNKRLDLADTSHAVDENATAGVCVKQGVPNPVCAMGPFESLVKPTNPFSEKCI